MSDEFVVNYSLIFNIPFAVRAYACGGREGGVVGFIGKNRTYM